MHSGKKGDKYADASKLPTYTLGGGVCTFLDFLKSEIKSSLDHLNILSVTTSWECYFLGIPII